MDIVIRAAVAYVFIIFMLRIVGRRELSSLGPTDIVLLVVMGDLVQNGVTQSDDSVTGIFLAISTFAMLTVAMSFLTFKSKRLQTVIEGAPVILVQDGKPDDAHRLRQDVFRRFGKVLDLQDLFRDRARFDPAAPAPPDADSEPGP